MKSLPDAINEYLNTVKYERKLSPDTIKAYRIDLQQFSEFTHGTWPEREPLSAYVKHLNCNFAPRSVKRKLASVRAFYHELEIQDAAWENPFDKLSIRIQTPKQLPRIIPLQTVLALLTCAYEKYLPGKKVVLRDIFVLELLFSTGLRVSELCALTKDTFMLSWMKRLLFTSRRLSGASAAQSKYAVTFRCCRQCFQRYPAWTTIYFLPKFA